jgi:hypothetical protein
VSGHVGFVVDEVALGQDFSEYFGFPCQFSFHLLLYTYLSSGAGNSSPVLAAVPSGLSLTPLIIIISYCYETAVSQMNGHRPDRRQA